MLLTVHLHTLDRPLSVIRDRPLLILWTVHFRFADRPLSVVLDRPLSSMTVYFRAFGPSIFTQLDRPLYKVKDIQMAEKLVIFYGKVGRYFMIKVDGPLNI